MAWTAAYAFDQYFDAVNLPGDHRQLANARKDWLVGRLNPYFDVLDAFAAGSIPRFTALQEHSDLDVMVVLNWTEHCRGNEPSRVLADVREALGLGLESVRANGQAVTVRFKSWPDVDVVPASRWSDQSTGEIKHYEIPDSHRGVWLKTWPARHARQIERAANSCGPQFRHLVKMVKDWNRRQPVRMQSYHIEVIALRMANENESFTEYGWALVRFFEIAQNHIWACLVNGEDITTYLRTGQYSTVLDQLKAAQDLATTGWFMTYNGRGRDKEAIAAWRSLMGNRFPPHG